VSARIVLYDVLNIFLEDENGDDHDQRETQASEGNVLVIRTDPLGSSYGRTYILRIPSERDFEEWYPLLKNKVQEENRRRQLELALQGNLLSNLSESSKVIC